MAKMGFAEAKRIRSESLSNRIASKLVGGETFGSSITKSLSEGTKAKITGLKEKINPMNIATKIKPISQDEGILELLNEIYLLLEDSRRARLRDMPTEEDIMERERKANTRHKALLDAINGKLVLKKETTATKEEPKDEDSIFDNVLAAFGLAGLAKSVISSIGTLAKWAVGPIGLPLLGAASIAAFAYVMYKMFTDESGFDKDPDSALNKGLRQAREVGGLAGVLDEMEKRKKLPEYERTMAELKDAEKTFWRDEEGNPQKGTDKQLEGYAKRGAEAAKAVEDYKKERDASLKPVEKTSESVAPASSQASTDTLTPVMSASTIDTATPVTSTPTSAAVSAATAENLEMNLPVPDMGTTPDTINNTTFNTQTEATQPVVDIPAVRNLEETFRNMILYSTRVV